MRIMSLMITESGIATMDEYAILKRRCSNCEPWNACRYSSEQAVAKLGPKYRVQHEQHICIQDGLAWNCIPGAVQ